MQYEYTRDSRAFAATTNDGMRRRASISKLPPSMHGDISAAKMSEHELSDAVFAITSPSTSANGFISHTWKDNAMDKYLALCSYLHLFRAVFFGWLCWLIFVLFLAAKYGLTGMGGFTWLKTYFLLIPSAGFFVAFFFANSIPWLGSTQRWWLDKLCIHQTRTSWKLAGVKQLPKFCDKSEQLIILWSEEYFSRLWCCCELATFSANHKLDAIKLQPLWLAPWILSTILVDIACSFIVSHLLDVYFAMFIEMYPTWGSIPALMISFSGYAPAIVPNLISFRAKARAHKNLIEQLENFDLKSCKCAVESDREHVEDHVNHLWGSLDKFNAMVRTDFHDIVVSSVGDASFMPLSLAVLPFLPLFWSAAADILGCDGGPCDEVAVVEGVGEGWRLVVTIFLEWSMCIIWSPFIYPTMFLALSYTEQFESLAVRNLLGSLAIFVPYVFYLGFLGGIGSSLAASAMIVGGWWAVFAPMYFMFAVVIVGYVQYRGHGH